MMSTKTLWRLASLTTLLVGAAGAWGRTAPGRVEPRGRGDGRPPLVLTYVANEGVLVSAGQTKVLIDALFDKPNAEYRAPSPEELERIMRGKPPYDGVDVLLVTHNHPDHFEPRLTVRYLEAFPGAALLAPADVVAEVRKAASDWGRIERRVIALDLKPGETAVREPNRIPVTVFRTLHGDRESPMNFMYLIELNGWRVFHEGDSAMKVEGYGSPSLGRAPVDLALVHFWLPLEPNFARFLQEVLKPDHIALMHLPIRLESDAPGKIDQVRRSYKDIFLLLPGMPAKVFR